MEAWKECCTIYDVNCPERSSELSEECVSLKEQFLGYLKTNTKLICEVPSLRVSGKGSSRSDRCVHDHYKAQDIAEKRGKHHTSHGSDISGI